jgi:alpha-tubulin suppressor-like RCC1 family protein
MLVELDYNTFLNFVVRSKIKGHDFLSLCSSSKKFYEYSIRSFEVRDKDGNIIRVDDQYLFRILLAKMRVKLEHYCRSPKQLYIERTIGGSVWIAGSNFCGQLGLGDHIHRHIPTLIPNFNNIIEMSLGLNHSLCLDSQGRVWGFGWNGHGQLGLGHYIDRSVPTLISRLGDIIQICCGSDYSLCLDNHGNVWPFGGNSYGQLGLGNCEELEMECDEYSLVKIPNLKNIVQVSTSNIHSLCLDDQGHVWSFGCNHKGQLGLGDYTNRIFPILIPTLENIIEIYAGYDYSFCLDNMERVWNFGYKGSIRNPLDPKEDDYINRPIPTVVPGLHTIIPTSKSDHKITIRK